MDHGRYFGLGPNRKLTDYGDGTYVLIITPAKWSGDHSSEIQLTFEQANRYRQWGTRIPLLRDALPDLLPEELETILTGTPLPPRLRKEIKPMSYDDLHANLKRTLAAFMESNDIDLAVHKEHLEELREDIETRIAELEDQIEEGIEEVEGEETEGEEDEERDK